jgi:hypothetical protein
LRNSLLFKERMLKVSPSAYSDNSGRDLGESKSTTSHVGCAKLAHANAVADASACELSWLAIVGGVRRVALGRGKTGIALQP